MALDHEDEPVLSDDDGNSSEGSSSKGTLRGIGKKFKWIASAVARTAVSAQEMLKDEELRKWVQLPLGPAEAPYGWAARSVLVGCIVPVSCLSCAKSSVSS